MRKVDAVRLAAEAVTNGVSALPAARATCWATTQARQIYCIASRPSSARRSLLRTANCVSRRRMKRCGGDVNPSSGPKFPNLLGKDGPFGFRLEDVPVKQLPSRSGEFLFEIIMRRYELKSTMMTSDRPLEDGASSSATFRRPARSSIASCTTRRSSTLLARATACATGRTQPPPSDEKKRRDHSP